MIRSSSSPSEHFREISLSALAVIVIIANCGGVDCNIVYCGVDQTRHQVQLVGMASVSVSVGIAEMKIWESVKYSLLN